MEVSSSKFRSSIKTNNTINFSGICLNYQMNRDAKSENEFSFEIQTKSNEILERTKLPNGWDDIRGVPVSLETAEYAVEVLQQIVKHDSLLPSIGAGSGGSIFLGWTKDEYEVEIEVDSLKRVHASRLNLKNDTEEYYEDLKKFDLLTDWIDELATHRSMVAE